jgi:hypothetical protein
MAYNIILMINLLSVIALNFLMPGRLGVDIDVHAPSEIDAGHAATIRINLDKSNIRSFARFQHKLPGGLDAEVVNDGNADFRFEDQTVKFIWLKLPQEEEINISYKINVNKRLKGNFQLEGSFDYIDNNERRSVSVGEKMISIRPSPSMDPEQLVDVGEFKPLVRPAPQEDYRRQVRCIRQRPYQKEGDAFQVNLLVNKGDKEKFAKIQENIPEGYRAVEQEGKGAIFTFKNQKAKFLWMNLPPDRIFVVSYKLVPETDEIDNPDIEGNFSYIEDRNTREIDIEELNVNLEDADQNHLLSVLRDQRPPVITADEGLTANDEEFRYEQSANESVNPQGKVKIEIAEEAKRLLEENANLTHKLEPQSGVYYRVQIAAGHRPINVDRYFDKYDIDKEVRTELHEGWRKYSVGSFSVYKEARDYRVHLWNTTTIDDAFVSAYNDGRRITVQEALMVTNHKWYR